MECKQMSTKVTWYGQEHLVKIEWDCEADELVAAKCLVDGKEIVKLFRGKWSNKKGKHFDRSHFITLRRCCLDNFKDAKNTLPAFMPIFSILHGEDL